MADKMFDIINDEEQEWLKAKLEAQKKYTLKQVIEWGNELCNNGNHNPSVPAYRRDCPWCQAELQAEAEK